MNLIEIKNELERLVKMLKPFDDFEQVDINRMMSTSNTLGVEASESDRIWSDNVSLDGKFWRYNRLYVTRTEDDTYLLYLYNGDIKCFTERYQTREPKEVASLILLEMINQLSWEKVCDIADSENVGYIYYGTDEENYEKKFKETLILQLPNWFQVYYEDYKCLDDRMESFKDSEVYKKWINFD